MSRRASVAVALLAIGSLPLHTTRPSAHRVGSARLHDETKARIATAYGRLPLHFEANTGQTDSQVRFLARGVGHTLFLTETEAVLVLTNPDPAAKGRIALRMAFVGANPLSRVLGLDELPGKANYFIGHDPSHWHTNVPLYATVSYHDLYPGIDLRYSGNQRQVESAFVVRPGAEPHRILLAWEGADSLTVDAEGDIVLHTALGLIRQRKPGIYQEVDGARRDIPGRYVRTGLHQLRFEVHAYDARQPLVIEGSTVFSITATR
jgi:hypothetical protein